MPRRDYTSADFFLRNLASSRERMASQQTAQAVRAEERRREQEEARRAREEDNPSVWQSFSRGSYAQYFDSMHYQYRFYHVTAVDTRSTSMEETPFLTPDELQALSTELYVGCTILYKAGTFSCLGTVNKHGNLDFKSNSQNVPIISPGFHGYLYSPKHPNGTPFVSTFLSLSPVERKIKSLQHRFSTKTLAKTKMKVLPFPKEVLAL